MLLYCCPHCGMTEPEIQKAKLQQIRIGALEPMKMQPAWIFSCIGCGWLEPKKASELTQIA